MAITDLFHVGGATLELSILNIFIANHLACAWILVFLDDLSGLLACVVTTSLLRYCFLLTVLDDGLL